jgi:hypothetical protein
MFVDRIKHRLKDGTIRTQYLLRTSKREGEKVTKTTILNITNWGSDVCEAIAIVLKNRHSLPPLNSQLQNTDPLQSSTPPPHPSHPSSTSHPESSPVWIYLLHLKIPTFPTLRSPRLRAQQYFSLRAETQRARSFYFFTRKDGKRGMRGKRTLKNFRSFRPSVLSALKKY